MNTRKWIALGCSHTSDKFSTPWPRSLSAHLGEPEKVMYSQGASNEFNLSKLIYAASLKPDLIIWQWTEVSRLSLGLNDKNLIDRVGPFDVCDGMVFHHQAQYTCNPVDNSEFLKNYGYRTADAEAINSFLIFDVMTSSANMEVKPLQTLLSGQAICRLAGVPLFCFFWNPFAGASSPLADAICRLLDMTSIVPESVVNFLTRKLGEDGYKKTILDGIHVTSDAHALIANELLWPFLEERL